MITVFRKLPVLRAGNGEEIQCFCEADGEKLRHFEEYIPLCPMGYFMYVINANADIGSFKERC